MLLLISILALVSAIAAHPNSSCTQRSCHSGWEPFIGTCYKFVYEGGNANTAQSKCRKLGGELATVRSQKHNDFFAGWIPTKFDRMWIGLQGIKSKWTWPDGTVLGDKYYSNMGPVSSSICGFESNLCDWSKQGRWDRRSGSTPSSHTGPSRANTGSYYVHVETSSPMKTGHAVRLISKTYKNDRVMCLKFAYHMYGATITWLRVYVKSGNNEKMIWSKHGNHGTSWMHASIDMSSYTIGFSTYKVVFEGTRGSSYTGDIALDDISVLPCKSGCIDISRRDKLWSEYRCGTYYAKTMYVCEKEML